MAVKRKTRNKATGMRLRFRKNDPVHNLYAAAQHYVASRGGHILVIGGIEVQDWHDGTGKFRVAVKCMGRFNTETLAPANEKGGE